MSPASSMPGSLDAQVVGCWALTWEATVDAAQEKLMAVPDSISLDDGPLFGTRGRLVSPATHPNGRGFGDEQSSPGPQTWEQRYRVNHWWVDGDMVEIEFSEDETAFWALRLDLQGGALKGSASYYERRGGEGELGASVDARRFTCGLGDPLEAPGP